MKTVKDYDVSGLNSLLVYYSDYKYFKYITFYGVKINGHQHTLTVLFRYLEFRITIIWRGLLQFDAT